MLLKISLALAILVGLATLYFTVGVSDKIQGLQGQVAEATTAKNTAEEGQRKANAELKTTKANLDVASKNVSELTNVLAGVQKDLLTQTKRADKASTELATTTEERNEARQELGRWNTLGLNPEQVRGVVDNNKRLEAERTTLQSENKTLLRNRNELQARLDTYERPEDREIPLPVGTHGKVVAVDPKYDFVVLDIGGNQGLLPNAKMLVNRDGKLIAKVKVTRVEPNRAIANVMPEWKQDEIIEGDQVVY